MNLKPSAKIYSGESKIKNAGRGVFAAQEIKKDEVIESCPIILINENEVPDLRKTELHNYYFMWGEDRNNHKAAVCLGFGSLYNHSYSPNATYHKLKEEGLIKFVAIKDINKDEEISVNYNFGNPDDKTKLWIEKVPSAEDS
jgi:SET domain-containing protein